MSLLRFARYGCLFIAGAAGLYSLITDHPRLAELREEQRSLTKTVSPLTITDPDKVHISAIPSSTETLPPGIDKAYIWRFRVYFPANYALKTLTLRGSIAAQSPVNNSGSSSSSISATTDPLETMLMISIVRTTDGNWKRFYAFKGSSSGGSLPPMRNLDSLEGIEIEPIVAVGDEPKSFDRDEVICLFRLRETTPAINRRTQQPKTQHGRTLYRGLVTYLMDESREKDFDAWAAGVTQTLEKSP